MKATKVFLAIFMSLVFALGMTFYTTSTSADESACEAGVACGKCGDGYCNPRCGETAQSCPRDCGGVPSTSE